MNAEIVKMTRNLFTTMLFSFVANPHYKLGVVVLISTFKTQFINTGNQCDIVRPFQSDMLFS